MSWPPDIAGDLPTSRDDEPSSLRQDIADELADHLHSSFTRELYFTPEETSAKHIVLDRFGDPRAVARQLWFDAMKEKIVSQRLNLVMSSLMTAACLGALAMMFLMLRDSHEVNAAILERMQALVIPKAAPAPTSSETPKSFDWIPLRYKLVLGKKGGPPAVGFKVHVQSVGASMVLGETEKEGRFLSGVIEETIGADGMADLGLFRFGSYLVTVTAPWGEFTRRQIGLRPGQEPIREIVCPAAPPDDADVSFAVEWPDDLKPHGLWLLCDFTWASRHIGVDTWQFAHPPRVGFANGRMSNELLILKADGSIAVREVTAYPPTQLGMGGGMMGQGMPEAITFVSPSRFDESERFPALVLRMANVLVVNPNDEAGSQTCPILAQYTPGGMGYGGMGAGMGGGMGGGFFNVEDKGRPSATQKGDGFSFEPKPGQANRWTLRLPDGILDQVRVKLKLIPDPAKRPETDEE